METATFTERDGAKIYFAAILFNVLLQAALSIVLSIFGASSIVSVDWVSILFSLVIEIGYVGVAVYFIRKCKARPQIGIKPLKPYGYVLSALVAVLCIVCFYLTASAFQLLLDKIGYVSQGGITLDSLAAKILGIAVTCVVAPVAEELVFRGALLSGLRQRFKEPAAIVLSAAAFSLMHMNPEQTVYQFLLGLVLAFVSLRCVSLVPAILIHACSNLIAVLLDIVPPLNAALAACMDYLVHTPWLFAVLAVVLFAAGVAAVFFSGKLFHRAALPLAEKTRLFPAHPALRMGKESVFGGETKKERGGADDAAAGAQIAPKENGNAAQPVPLMAQGFKPKTLYIIAVVVCSVMWLSVFFISMFTYLFPAV